MSDVPVSLIARASQMATTGALRKSQSLSTLQLINLGLTEAFTGFEVPGKPTRFLVWEDPAMGLSELRASCVFRRLKSRTAMDRLIEQTLAKRADDPELIAEFVQSISDFISVGGPDDMLCMFKTNRGPLPDPDATAKHGWLWLSSCYKLKKVRQVG